MQNRLPVLKWCAIGLVCVWSLFPIYWALNTSFMTDVTAQSTPAHFFPSPFDLGNYRYIFGDGGMLPAFSRTVVNTTLECVLATLVTIVVAVFGAYPFARMKFKFKSIIFYLILATMSLPSYTTLIPLYRLMSQWGLVNTMTGLVLVYVSGFLPLAVWIMYNYFNTIPTELEEAAFVDGVSGNGALFRIMIPLSLPGIASTAIITFLSAWGQFLFPLVLSSDQSTQPLTVFMTEQAGKHTIPYTLLNSIGVLSIIVPAVIVMTMNRFIIRGILAGSIK